MSKVHTRPHRVQEPGVGMNRFFSPVNLDRYRKLASATIDEVEQHQLLKDLAEEMNAFRREAREAAVDRGPHSRRPSIPEVLVRYEHTT